jgi:cytoskeletal protein CcmA (bactofilin family)
MFKKEAAAEILSILGEGVELSGELRFTNGLRVDGAIRGKLVSEGTLQIGPKGRVDAEMEVRRVSINGEFHGTIHAAERIEIHRDGHVYGDLFTPCLIIEAGAMFEGRCNMSEQAAKREEPALLKVVETGGEGSRAAQLG